LQEKKRIKSRNVKVLHKNQLKILTSQVQALVIMMMMMAGKMMVVVPRAMLTTNRLSNDGISTVSQT
jgi:hypothetical protein